MASSMDSQSLIELMCYVCKTLPADDQVHQCSRGHFVCLKCARSKRCKCQSTSLVIIPNPLLRIVKPKLKECIYKIKGCMLMISPDDKDHILECRFRPYNCIGAQLGVWSCNWNGIQQQFAPHMLECHSQNGEFFTHWQESSVEYVANKNITKFNLVDAFNKKFVFLYMCHAKNPNVIFLIYLIGRKTDAQKYMIDFELKDELRKMKFIETCFSDADNIPHIVEKNRCFIIPKKMFETYAKNNAVGFRFVIKKKEIIEQENVVKQKHLQNVMLGTGQTSLQQPVNQQPQKNIGQSGNNLKDEAPRSHFQSKYRRNFRK